MDLPQLKKDYHEVRNTALRVFESNINPIRCHEMAYLIATGLKRRGYDTRVEDGLYEGRVEHSWVQIRNGGDFWILNKDVLIDFQFNPWSWVFTPPIWTDRVVIDYKQKRLFKKTKINYQLAEGIEGLAEQLFLGVIE